MDLDDKLEKVLDDLLDLACGRASAFAWNSRATRRTIDRLKLGGHVGRHGGCGGLQRMVRREEALVVSSAHVGPILTRREREYGGDGIEVKLHMMMTITATLHDCCAATPIYRHRSRRFYTARAPDPPSAQRRPLSQPAMRPSGG